MTQDETIAAEILRLAEASGPARSISPEDVAKALSADWHPLLGKIRKQAAVLATQGRIDILRKGKPIPPEELRGVIRLRLRAPEPSC